jgi:hypothetical protein
VSSDHVPSACKLGEAFGVLQPHFWVALGHSLIAGQFALPAYFSVGKPGGGVKEDEAACETRQKIPEIVAAFDVRELMAQNMGKLSRA